jgi:hypothetical protein
MIRRIGDARQAEAVSICSKSAATSLLWRKKITEDKMRAGVCGLTRRQ